MEAYTASERVLRLKNKMLAEPRYASIEQALIITRTYQENEQEPVIIKRALALKNALLEARVKLYFLSFSG